MRTVRRLRLRFCLIDSHRLLCCRLRYLALSKPSHPHQKYFIFTNRASLICWVLKYFWWRWGESNSRPEHILFEGITTISLES